MYTKNHKLRHKVDNWLRSWIALVENIIVILTFTAYYPNWEFNLACKQIERDSKRRRSQC